MAGGLVFLLVVSIREAISFTDPLPEIEPYEGSTPGDTGPGNQFVFNGSLVELDKGESPLELDELMDQLSEDCIPESIERKQSDDGLILLCHSKGQGELDPLAGLLPSVAWVQRGADGKSSYMKLNPKEPIEVGSLVPSDGGDSEGFDIEGVPRGPNMDRWMSFADPTGSYRSVFYGRGSGSIESTMLWFREALPQAGWTLIREKENSPYLFATGHSQLVMISLTKGCEGLCASVMATPL